MLASFRVVLDTNILVRGIVSGGSPAATILAAADERRFTLLLSKPVLREYSSVLSALVLSKRFASLTPATIEVLLERLRYLADYQREINVRFLFPRDPADRPFLELAIAGGATHLVTADPDLLGLPAGRDDSAKRLRRRCPNLRVVDALNFSQLCDG